MGFGLFLPLFSAEFGIPEDTAGLIAGAGFGAFLTGLLISAFFTVRYGARLPVAIGGLCALAGFVLIATASNTAALTAGVVIAGCSPALCWAPFNDAAEYAIAEDQRSHALSSIATGTAVGVTFAAGLSFAVTQDMLVWRSAWWLFALAAILSIFATVASVPKHPAADRPNSISVSGFVFREAMWLYGLALVFGATNAVFISFAAERIANAGGVQALPKDSGPAILFLSYGLCGLLGLLTGRAEAFFGLPIVLRAIFAAAAISMMLIAHAPSNLAAVLVASGMHGAALMAVSAVVSFWSLRLFPGRGTLGFTVALIALGLGSLIGPVLAGFASEGLGSSAMFWLSAIPACLICFWPRGLPNSRPG